MFILFYDWCLVPLRSQLPFAARQRNAAVVEQAQTSMVAAAAQASLCVYSMNYALVHF